MITVRYQVIIQRFLTMNTKVIFAIVLGLATSSLAISCPGCPMNLDVRSPSSMNHLRHYVSGAENIPKGSDSEPVTPTKLIKATSQVVSGIKYTYDFEAEGQRTGKQYNCHLVVVSKPWLPESDAILKYNCLPQAPRNKRSLPGAEFEVSLNEIDDLGDMENLITKELKKMQQTPYAMGIVKFLKATRQIVSGFLTKLTVEVAETNCLSADAKPYENCSFFKKEGHKVCDVHVWDQPWKQRKEITKLECNDKPQYCAGCVFETSANDQAVTQSLERTLFNLNTQSSTHLNLRKINKVQYQIVAGVKYMIEFEAENETKSLDCTTVIVLQPWLSEEPSVEVFDCNPSPHME